MKIKELLEDYTFAQSGTSIEHEDEAELSVEMDRRLKLFGYDRDGASEFTIPFDDLWTGKTGYTSGHSRHVQLVDPDYKKVYGSIDWQDPEGLRGNIKAVRNGNPANYSPRPGDAPERGENTGRMPDTVFASAQIAQFEQGVKDAEHFQKTVARMPDLLKQTDKDSKDSKDGDDVGAGIGASIGGALGSAVKGVSNAWDAGVAAFKDRTKESSELQRIIDITRH
jgi:hypothetical protein